MAQDLPASMRADKYLLEATRATESGDRQAAQRAFDIFESLDVEPTPLFAYRYGSALVGIRHPPGSLAPGSGAAHAVRDRRRQ